MYAIAPCPDLAYKSTMHAWWNNAFTDQELDAICEMGERVAPNQAVTGDGETNILDKSMRDSTISWIKSEGWLAEKLQHVTRSLNGEFFGLDLWGFGEDFQYTVYKYTKQHYTWHMDQGYNKNIPRKLSLVLMLSDPNDYKGGDLQIFTGNEPITLSKERGMIHAFPSYIMHRVTPVTSGTRRTLVVWVSGPRFK